MDASREYKRALNRISTFKGNLQKDLEDIESQRMRSIRSLREKKMNFMEKAASVPKLRLSLPGQTNEVSKNIPVVTKRPSLDDLAESVLWDGRLAKERLSASTTCQVTQDCHLTKFQRATLPNSPLARRRQSEIQQHKTKLALNRHHSLPVFIATAEKDHYDPGRNVDQHDNTVSFKANPRVPTPFLPPGTKLCPSSPCQRWQRNSLCPTDQQQSVSVPCSPRFGRRRAETWNPEPSQERKDTFAELSLAARKMRSLSLDDEAIPAAGREVRLHHILFLFVLNQWIVGFYAF